MRAFIKIWVGQLVSTIGSYMTVFALMIWIWQETGSATTLALVTFFSQLPRIAVTPFAGIIVDRFPRKQLMLLGDVVAALGTLVIGLLFWQGQLQLWHLYIVVTLYGCFGQLQTLAYSTSVALLVSKENYARAESMVAAVGYSGAIFSPILAGSLYPIVGLTGIIAIDLVTFAIAFVILLLATIPNPESSEEPSVMGWQSLTFGFRYILSKPSLIAMVIAFSCFAVPSDIGKALYNPMILARSGGDAQVLGWVTTAAGVGGVLGAFLVGIPNRIARAVEQWDSQRCRKVRKHPHQWRLPQCQHHFKQARHNKTKQHAMNAPLKAAGNANEERAQHTAHTCRCGHPAQHLRITA
ncbi:MAG: MFS transporter, partial [Cyanobacteria bacterium J06635_11]